MCFALMHRSWRKRLKSRSCTMKSQVKQRRDFSNINCHIATSIQWVNDISGNDIRVEMFTHMCIHTHKYINMYTHMHRYQHMILHIKAHTYMHTRISACTNACACMHEHIYIYTHTNTCKQIYEHDEHICIHRY